MCQGPVDGSLRIKLPKSPKTSEVSPPFRVALCYPDEMSLPVKLSDALVLDARLAGEALERSLTGQVEFWARLGRAIEPLLQGTQVLALCRSAKAQPLSACLETADSPDGRRRVSEYLEAQPFPHYEQAPNEPGYLVRIDVDGKRIIGKFVNRKFQVRKPLKKRRAT